MNKEALTVPVLEALLQTPSFAVTGVDKQGCVILWSRSASRMFGWTESEALGRPLPIIPQDQRSEFLDQIQNAIRDGIVIGFGARRLRKDGSLIDVNLWTTPLKDGKGDIIGVLGVHADVTAREKTEPTLRQTEAELRRVLAAVSDYLWSGEIDPDGRFSYHDYSPAVERITGRPASFFLEGPERWLNSIHPEDRPRVAEAFARLQAGQSDTWKEEYRFVRPDGAIRWVRDSVTVSQSMDGRRYLNGVVSDITVQRQTEEALRDSEARFRGIFTAAGAGIVQVSPEGRVLQANPAFCEFLGYSEQELFGKTVQDITHPDDWEGSAKVMRQILEGEQPLIRRFEKRYVDKRGQTVWGEVSILLIRGAIGKASYTIAHVLDITERKKAEAALQESEQRFRTLIEHSFDVISVVIADATIQFTSASASRVLGYQPQELAGRNALDFVHPEDLPRITDAFHRLVQTPGGTMVEQFRCRHKDGSWRWVEASGTNCFAEPTVRGIVLNWHDITLGKRSEEELRSSEERYRLMAEAIPQPVWRCNAQGETVECNRRWYEYTGQSLEEARGNGWMKALHPDDVGRVMQKLQDDVASGELHQAEYRLRRASDGSYRWHLGRALPIRDKDGRIVCWFGSAVDIDDQKRAQEALEKRVRERTAELAKANEAFRQSEAKYRTLVEEIPAITYIAALDKDSTTLYVSPQAESLLGLTLADDRANLHTIWHQHLHPDDRERVTREFRRTQTSGEPFDCEYRMLNHTGGIVWFRDKAAEVRDETGCPLFRQGVMLDITEQKGLEQVILDVGSREQMRIGQDLHDSLCQRLMGIAFMWKTIADKVAERLLPEAAEIAEIGRLIAVTVDEAHGLARGLCPVELENNDLRLALKELGSSVEQMFGVSCSVRCPRPMRLADKSAALHLYRIAQEAISNAIYHGKAKHVWIDFTLKKNTYTLRVRDNGVGFSGEQLCKNGAGIRGMRCRAQMIGGLLTIESQFGGGTNVECVYTRGRTRA